MDKGSYQYTSLEAKYDQFLSPAFELTIGSKTVANNEVSIPQLEVEISADGKAGGCAFTLEAQYDHEGSRWLEQWDKVLMPGAKIVVKGGYVQKKEIFYGYVDDYTMEFTHNGAPRIHVTGIDGLGYLMSCWEPVSAGKKKVAEVVKGILNKSVSAGFAKKVTVGTLSTFETPIVKDQQVDDWRFLRGLAQQHGVSLMAVDGELIFDDVMTNKKPLLSLQLSVALYQIHRRVSLARQVGQVEILGRDVNQKPIKGVASTVSVGGTSKSAAQLVPALKNVVLQGFSEVVRTEEECKKLAQNHLNAIAMGLVTVEAQCIGIPEIIPGRYITLEGAGGSVDGDYFINHVKHTFSRDNGYTTDFSCKGAKIK